MSHEGFFLIKMKLRFQGAVRQIKNDSPYTRQDKTRLGDSAFFIQGLIKRLN